MSINQLIKSVMIAVLYVVLVSVFSFLSFDAIQFRIAEALLIIFLFNKKASTGLLIGTFLANYLLSPAGIVDAVFGTLATGVALLLMMSVRSIWLKLLMPGIANGLIIGAMLHFLFELPLIESIVWVFIGESAVMILIGYPLYAFLKSHKRFQTLIHF